VTAHPSRDDERLVWKARLATGVLVLAAIMFRQAPGLVVPDTKLDLTANPGGFLTRALHIWDPQGALGQLQNQAYGYLFPVGPFHWLLVEAGLPAWVMQRLWWTTIVAVAFLGMWRLAAAIGVGTNGARYLGAFLFALSPRMLSEVAVTSVEVWPLAVAPWVLYPLVTWEPRSWGWRITRSVVAVFCVGGVNAVASGAVLVLPALWFATRSRPLRILRPALAWLGGVTLACLWWLVPLVMLGRYSPPFLDWIEDARVTTGLASAFNALQGTSPWLDFLAGPAGPAWPAGWLLVTTPALILSIAVAAALGLAGLTDRLMPERLFLLTAAMVGLVLLTLGYAGAGASPFAELLRAALDGPLAPLRNTHKFELVLQVPLVLGAIHAMSRLQARAIVAKLPGRLGPLVAICLVVAVSAPALTSGLPRAGAYASIPSYWHDAAAWLDAQPADGTVLVEPAASFADLTWGAPKDEPLQALMRRPFVVRDAVPLGSAGATRVLDEIERRMGEGSGGPALADLVASLGVRYVLVRNDLSVAAQGSPPMAVHQALTESGLPLVKSFGPPVASPVDSQDLTVNERTLLPYGSVEIFEVTPKSSRFVPASQVFTATAGPENLAELDAVAGPSSAALLGSDALAAPRLVSPRRHILTDGLRRREVFFGDPSNNTSATLAASDPGRGQRRALDYVADSRANQSVLRWSGIASVTSSSSASDAGATLRLGVGTSPASAVDGDPTTRWVSGRYLSAVGEWLEIDFGAPRSLVGLHIRFSAKAPVTRPPSQVFLETDHGVGSAVVKGTGEYEPVIAPPGLTERLRIRLGAVSGDGPPNGFAISEIELPGLAPTAGIAAPARQWGRGEGAVVLREENLGRSGCLHQGGRPLCTARFESAAEAPTEFSRTFTTTTADQFTVSARVLPREGAALEKLLAVPGSIQATASSRDVAAPEGRPDAAVDRDLGTGWVAAGTDAHPRLTLRLPKPSPVSGLQFLSDAYLAASRPREVSVRLDGGQPIALTVDREGFVRFPEHRTSSVEVTFTRDTPLTDVDALTAYRSLRPVGVSEVRVLGADQLRHTSAPDRRVAVPCGFGPTIAVGGRQLLTAVDTTAAELLGGQPLPLRVCSVADPVISLSAGHQSVDARSTAEFRIVELRLVDPSLFDSGRAAAPAVPATLHRLTPTAVTIELPARAEGGLVVLPQSFNAGWEARDPSGRTVPAVRVNGWQQGWVVQPGAPMVLQARFPSDTPYRLALGAGLLAALALASALFVTSRRRSRGLVAAGIRAVAPGPLSLSVATLVLLGFALGWVGCAGWLGAVVACAVLRRTGWQPAGSATVATAAVGAAVLVAWSPWTRGAAATDSLVVQGLDAGAFALAVLWSAWTASSEDAVRTSNARL
jgi:arabinofuranan 3-O-arabinosyltransferase